MFKKIGYLSLFLFISVSAIAAPETPETITKAESSTLLPDEKNNIDIFQKAAPKVVYVHRLSNVADGYNSITQVPSGAGSGIIWDAKGHVVTNFHVIKDADNLAVSFGGMTVPVKVIGAEPRKDLAVLLIQSQKALDALKNFEPFTVIHSKDLMVGQKAIAIGNPFGLDHSLTVGVISALGRKVPGIGGVSIHGMIQTDASVNPGNSGGPLLDSAGRLIGLNTMIYSRSGTSSGVSFVVPSDDVERVVNQIIVNGRVKLPGIGIQRVDANIAKQLGVNKGLLIGEVMPNTPASKAGLLGTKRDRWGQIYLGDVVVGLNNQEIPDYDTFYNLLTNVKVGDIIDITVLRKGTTIHFKLKTIDIGGY